MRNKLIFVAIVILSSQCHADSLEFKQGEKVRPIIIKVDSQVVVDSKNDNALLSIIALVASFAAVGIAFWQTKISQDTAKHQLRAYLGIAPYYDFDEVEGLRACFTIKNFGQTPAYEVQQYLITGVSTFPYEGEFDVVPMNENPSVILPGGFININSYHPTTIEGLASIELGERSYYFWGEIQYLDIYKKLHRNKFTFVRHSTNPKVAIDNYLTGNEAD